MKSILIIHSLTNDQDCRRLLFNPPMVVQVELEPEDDLNYATVKGLPHVTFWGLDPLDACSEVREGIWLYWRELVEYEGELENKAKEVRDWLKAKGVVETIE